MRLAICLPTALGAVMLATGAQAAGLADENLLTGLPKGFELGYQTTQGQLAMAEYVPTGETVDQWSRMVTVQIMHGISNADGRAFAAHVAELWQAACKNSTVDEVGSGEANGYPFVLWRYTCALNPETGQPESTWLKAISGADALYIVQYAYRAMASDDLERPALDYLGGTSVCDTRRPEHACPSGM